MMCVRGVTSQRAIGMKARIEHGFTSTKSQRAFSASGGGQAVPEVPAGICKGRKSFKSGVPTGIRTPVLTVKGWCPRPLDDGDNQ
jgi:hypothetical protein